jgi:RND family efflux transporter MFP subunit
MTPHYPTLALAGTLLLALTACKEEVKPVEEIRPVRYTIAGQDTHAETRQFSGEIRARQESRLGFRVAGKVVEKRVNSGDNVKKGQVLAVLDASDYQLDNQAKQAQLAAAQANLVQQDADLKRYRELLTQNFVSTAQVERQQTAVQSAKASVQQAQAALSASRNQAGYTSLIADNDGVVSEISIEPGQVVAAGQVVARVAAAGEREVLIQVPENAIADLRKATTFSVKAWAGQQDIAATLRELSGDADPATRTYAARLKLAQTPPELRLGMTATVVASLPGKPDSTITLPLAAILDEQGKHYVWVIDAKTGKVGRKPVSVGNPGSQGISVTTGLHGGEHVVTAGVHLLREGQRVTLLAK